ncbi:MAG: hypothetical protein HZA14_07605 [Nitrospirae bacterium]|nr:hypothetical protein [Nitrospirota bacterium]
MTIDSANDIAAGSSLGGFSFTVNQKVRNLAYAAEFDDHAGNLSTTSGTTALVPEPISSIFFVLGGVVLAGRRYLKSKRRQIA